MVRGFACLLICQLLGEIVARAVKLPIPGPVLGMGMMVVVLAAANRGAEGRLPREIEGTAEGLLDNLGLLFVPAGVGVIQYGGLLASYGLAIGLAVLVSTLAALLVTVGTFLLVKRVLGHVIETEA